MGHSGHSTGMHLHFEMRQNGEVIDPEDYIDPNNPRPVTIISSTSGEGGISLTTTTLSKATFKKALQEYYNKTKWYKFKVNFLDEADTVYDASVKYGVNPELVVVTAEVECGYDAAGGGGSYNYWGIGAYNGAGGGMSFSSLSDGIRGYANTLKEYRKGGSYANAIMEKYNERKDSGCDPTGYGLPGTFSGMQSVYSYLGRHIYGNSADGGFYYMDPARAGVTAIYKTHEEFVQKCLNKHASGSDTTPYEQGQYTAWQIKGKIDVWNKIFGKYATLSTSNVGVGNGTVVQKAIECHKYLRTNGYTYGGGYSIPDGIYNNSKIVDCSAYVSWVLYCAGNKTFNAWQETFFAGTYQSHGLTVVSENDIKPGDILVYNDHVEIAAKVVNGKVTRVYDCGCTEDIQNKGTSDCPESSEPHSPPYRIILRQPGSSSSSSSSSQLTSLLKKANITTATLNNKGAKQLVVVNSSGSSASVMYFEKTSSGWKENASLKCNGYVGTNGTTKTPGEGKRATPKGLFEVGKAFYRNNKPTTGLESFCTKDVYWVDSPSSKYYNQGIKGSTWRSAGKPHAEDMYSITPQYNYGFVIKFNMPPTGDARGSAIFFHVSGGGPTAGCVSVSESNVLAYLKVLNAKKKPYILII